VKYDLCVRMTASLFIMGQNERNSSGSRDTGTGDTVNVCRQPRVGRPEQPSSESSVAEQSRQPSRTQRRRHQRRRRLAIVTGQVPCGQPVPGVYSLPIRINRDTLREPITLGFRLMGGFVSIFEVPSGEYQRTSTTGTVVQGRRPAGLSDEEDGEWSDVLRASFPTNSCVQCGASMEEHCSMCNALSYRFPNIS